MTDQTTITLPPRYLIFGLECQFTLTALERLIRDHGLRPAAVVLPGPPNFAGVLTSPGAGIFAATSVATVSSLCQQYQIPLLRAGDLSGARTRDQLTRYPADLALVACFDRLLPVELINQFPLGVYNVHPSLLPDLRGPDPLFWTFKRGNGRAGITVHLVTGKFDAGPVLAQQRVSIADGISESELEQQLATLGVDLFTSAIPAIASKSIELSPQDHQDATWAPFPNVDDYQIDVSSTPRAAFNFVRGVRDRTPGAWFESGERRFLAVDAIEFGDGELPYHGRGRDEQVLAVGTGWIRLNTRPA